ncbi:uncharacterized protein LOC143031362 isoform X2 [Oratosquilla oratoria]|uniref:uncharacterized protein LOC143031362 isoform X2 n=1 Tax=Oratosquilla oratoria TaxID=337810 RepID=UPI003F75741B
MEVASEVVVVRIICDWPGYILELTRSSSSPVTDEHAALLPLCQVLETVLRKGLCSTVHSAFGITKRDYWAWLEEVSHTTLDVSDSYRTVVESVKSSRRVATMQSRGRLFIRHALQSRCLHEPVEILVRRRTNESPYDENDSIIGDEILGEIFLSLLYQCSRLEFDLDLDNASFLDDTWQLPPFVQYELVPCLDLGIFLGHVEGRAVVVRVEEGSIAAEDGKIEVGDIVDEVFNVCIHGWRRGRVAALMRQKKGLPVTLKIIKGHYKNGSLFPGVVPLLRRLQVDVDRLQEEYAEAALESVQETSLTTSDLGGQRVLYVGCVSVGGAGDVSRIEHAVTTVVSQAKHPIPVCVRAGEIGVQTIVRATRKVLLHHSYTEISSCGRRNDMQQFFAYIAGDTSCALSSHFTCFVFQAPSVEQSRDILLTLADGFHRTHWAV